LCDQALRCRQRANVVERADAGEEGRSRGHSEELNGLVLHAYWRQGDRNPRNCKSGEHDRNAATSM
jgi:hypothetical protein